MLRRSFVMLGGGMVEYHEWHLHEPLLQNYEGWRILDNPKYENKIDAYVSDFGGSVRHLDPIIDDPRLTHKQRVCRLYRWGLKELQMWLIQLNAHKLNLAYKVVRGRFEQYRYVTDPATCDMMVRQTQKYLSEIANYHYLRRNNASPWGTYTLANPMFHPDNAQVYDHWTHPEVFWYDDLKLHRWSVHHPASAGAGEMSDRFGDMDVAPNTRRLTWAMFLLWYALACYHLLAFANRDDDYHFDRWREEFTDNLAASMYAEERNSRSPGSVLRYDWDRVMGRTGNLKPPHLYDSKYADQTDVY